MKYIFINIRSKIVAATIGAALWPFKTLAQVTGGSVPRFDPIQGLTSPVTTVRDMIAKIANIFGVVVMGISVIMILMAAFNFLTGGGNEEKITKARNLLIYALVGVAVALLSFALPGLVSPLLQGGPSPT